MKGRREWNLPTRFLMKTLRVILHVEERFSQNLNKLPSRGYIFSNTWINFFVNNILVNLLLSEVNNI